MYKSKLQEIKTFLRPYANMPAQGTAAWKEMRGIGGSEMHMLLTDEKRLVAQKLDFAPGPSNVLSCNWGSTFESTLRNITSRVFDTPIYEATSIPSAEVLGKTYSMDGIGVVRFASTVDGETQWNWLTTLFEYKCTFTRQPVTGVVYRDYMPQVLSGMCDLALPEIAIYVESVFRISRYEDLGNNTRVEDWLHRSRNPSNWLGGSGNPHQQLPMCYGFMAFYVLNASIPNDPEYACMYKWLASGEIDFAKLNNSRQLNTLFGLVKSKHIQQWDSEVCYQAQEWKRCTWFDTQHMRVRHAHVDMDSEVLRFYDMCKARRVMPLGVLGYKLLDINVVTVEKQHGYTKQYEVQITSALEKIKKLKSIPDFSDRIRAYNEMYGIVQKTHCLDIPDYIC